MASPYPVKIVDESGVERLSGEADFTDQANQPGNGGLPQGWTQDLGNPNNVVTHGSTLSLGSAPGANELHGASGFNPDIIILSGGISPQNGATINSGSGAPALGGGAGDLYYRYDTPATPWYRCTTQGNPGVAVWTNLAALQAYVVVQAMPPAGPYQAPLVYDSTAVTGGCYAWDGAAYQKISNVVA